MYKLKLRTTPYWLDLSSGVRIRVKPLTTSIYNASMSWALAELKEVVALVDELKAEDKVDPELPNIDDDRVRENYINTMLLKGCALSCIIEWEGIEDPCCEGDLAPVTDDNVLMLMEDIRMGNPFWRELTTSFDKLVQEGNESSHEQSGTSTEEVPIAQGVVTVDQNAQTEKK